MRQLDGAPGRQDLPHRRDGQLRHVALLQRVAVNPLRHGLQLGQESGDRRRRVLQAGDPGDEALVQLPARLLAELVDLGDHGVGQGVAHLQHLRHEVDLAAVLGAGRLKVDKPFRALGIVAFRCHIARFFHSSVSPCARNQVFR
jgi:hypothetical protein